jgi:hypothetical protein
MKVGNFIINKDTVPYTVYLIRNVLLYHYEKVKQNLDFTFLKGPFKINAIEMNICVDIEIECTRLRLYYIKNMILFSICIDCNLVHFFQVCTEVTCYFLYILVYANF